MTDGERLLTPKEAAARLAVSERAILEWLRNGTLKGVKAGNRWRVRPQALEDFLKEP